MVKEANLSHTILTNEDGELITISTKHIIGEIIHNSQADTILELSVGIAYDFDASTTIDLLKQSLASLDVLSTDRPVQVGIDNFGDSSIDTGIRCWAPTENFHEVRYKCTQAVHDILKERGIDIPFAQKEVRMLG